MRSASPPTRPAPRDFSVDFSPARAAELVMWEVDERPPAPLSPRGLVRALRAFGRGEGRDKRHANDVEAERAWEAMGAARGEVSAEAFAELLRRKFGHDPLRTFEYAFQCRCLARPDVRTDVVVDMGGGNSYSTVVPLVLLAPGSRIVSVDVVNHAVRSRYDVEYVRGDCIHTSLASESADVVAIISTLEHVGLGRWGDPLDVAGDVKAMREARRLLRPGGHVILTVPYGFPTVVYNLHRIYDSGRLARLAEGFEEVASEFSLLGQPATREQVEGRRVVRVIPGFPPSNPLDEQAPLIPGGAMLLLRRTAAA